MKKLFGGLALLAVGVVLIAVRSHRELAEKLHLGEIGDRIKRRS